MSSYDTPGAEHTNAVTQLSEARSRCIEYVSVVREQSPNTFDTHLVSQPPSRSEQTLVKANQAVAEYLLQLHPYRLNSEKWSVDMGTVMLPEHVRGIGSNRRGTSYAPKLRACRMPGVSIGSVSDVISAINMNVSYSQNFSDQSRADKPGTEVRVGEQSVRVDEETLRAWWSGGLTREELLQRGQLSAEEERAADAFEPADPPADRHQARAFKFVFPPDMLLGLVEHADEIAAEMDMLADIEDKTGRDTEGL